MAGKFELYKDKAGEYRFRLKASNGQAILVGEGYKARGSAKMALNPSARMRPMMNGMSVRKPRAASSCST